MIFFRCFSLLLIAVAITCCNEQKTLRDNINQQVQTESDSKMKELKPAEGTLVGTMHVTSSNQDFDCQVDVTRTSVFVRNTGAQVGAETIEVPRLSGSIRFPSLEAASMSDLASFSTLTAPMGGYLKVLFDSGEYNPRSQKMILPYSVPGYSEGEFGELNGILTNGTYQGTWFSKPYGNVGTFTLKFQKADAT